MENKDKLVGSVSNKVCTEWNIKEHEGKPIFQTDGWANCHGSKHKKQFKSIYSFNQAINNIPLIIREPDHVFYDEKKKGLEYFKNLEEHVTLIVRVTGKKHLYVATIYPSSITKLENRKSKEVGIIEPDILLKYMYKSRD